MARRILIVESDPGQLEIVQSLLGDDMSLWRTEVVSDTVQALELLEQRYFDLVLCAMNVFGQPGVDFLNDVWQRYPRISRLLICNFKDQEVLTQCTFSLHQVVLVPCDAAVFRQTLQRIFTVEDLIGDRKFKDFAMRARTFPSIPSLYFRIVKEVQSPNASAENLAELISKDLAVTTKMLQAANSAFYGLQQQVTQLKDAIIQLGMETMKTLVLSIQVFTQFDKVKPLYFSIDSVWRHSHAVADRAKKIAMEVNSDARLAEEAFMAGLLHDIGKVVLACNCEKQYRSTMDNACRLRVHQAEAERNEFGFTHGEAGGYLASQLGMPASIIEAITLHHQPSLSPQARFSPLTAVHIADILEHHGTPNTEGHCPPKPDLEYLESLGLSDHFAQWLAGDTIEAAALPTASSIPSESAASRHRPQQASQVQDQVQLPVQSWRQLSRWWPLALGVPAALAALILWFGQNAPDQKPQAIDELAGQPGEQVVAPASQSATNSKSLTR